MNGLHGALLVASLAACGSVTIAPGDASVADDAPAPVDASAAGMPDASPADASAASAIAQVAASFGGFFVRFDDGRLFCRTVPTDGLVSLCDLAPRTTSGAWRELDLPPVQQVAIDRTHACVVLREGTVRCWGTLSREGRDVAVAAPTEVAGLADVVALSLRSGGACALDRRGAVWCWGLDPLGAGTPPSADRPLRVELPQAARSLGGGEARACAGLVDGQAWCWGAPIWDHLHSRGPTRDVTLESYTVVDVAEAADCGLDGEGRASCRGNIGVVPTDRWAVITRLTTPLRAVSVGQYSACGVTTEATVDCWGFNGFGMLGAPRAINFNLRVGELRDVVQVFAFPVGACALRRTGALVCWGARLDSLAAMPPHEVELPR
ncbi:MAG: hypothetical protein U0324_01390 [Polyangiales bacterium]